MTKRDELQPGFYWVRGAGPWVIGKWDGTAWWEFGTSQDSPEPFEIGERIERKEPPKQSKIEILRDAGYAYTIERGLYINRTAKKAFSVEFIKDHDGDRILEAIREHADGPGWRFYFNSEPSEAVKLELERALTILPSRTARTPHG